MHRWIIVGLMIFFLSSAAFSLVDVRLTKISESEAGGTVTLVVAVEVYATYSWQIYNFQNQFYVGDALRDLSPTVTYTDPNYFPTAQYDKTIGYQDGYCQFQFTEKSDGTGKTIDKKLWVEILRFTFQYPVTHGVTNTFSWSSHPNYFSWTVESWNVFLGAPYDVTGNRMSMPADLVDMTLPVQMGQIAGKYSYEQGVILSWRTESELNLAGFHVLRGESPEGPFTRVSSALIPGHGTTSQLHEYQFVDSKVEWNKTYYYMLHEISTTFMDTSKTYYGPLVVKTGEAPVAFQLSQNYPNPFNPSTEIQYVITEPAHVSLTIFNLLGKEVKVLVDEDKPAGIYQVSWDGKDAMGKEAPSGIYFYRINAGEKSEIRKMTKIK